MWLAVIGLVVILVMTARRTAIAYIGGQPREIELAPIGGGHFLAAPAAAAFHAMRAAAALNGVELRVNSSFRTMAQQQQLYARYLAGTGALAAKPGFSNHQGGIAVDIDVFDDEGRKRPAYDWLHGNAERYAFRRTVASEPWHWEYLP